MYKSLAVILFAFSMNACPSDVLVSDASIDRLEHLSECRAVLDYYKNLISIAILVNSHLGDKSNNVSLDRLLRDVDQSEERLSIQQELLVKNHLHQIPADVILGLIAHSYADGLAELDSHMASPLLGESTLDRSKFLEEFEITYKKCTNFLYEG